MSDLSVFFSFLKKKILFKSPLIKSDHRVVQINKLDPYGKPNFALDYSATLSAAKMCTNSNEHSMHIRFIWSKHKLYGIYHCR